MKKSTILNILAAVFIISNSASAQTIKFYKGSYCAAEFGCTNDEPLGVLVSKKRYRSMDKCFNQGLLSQLADKAIVEECGQEGVITGYKAWVANNVNPDEDQITPVRVYAYKYKAVDGSTKQTKYAQSKSEANQYVNAAAPLSIYGMVSGFIWMKKSDIKPVKPIVSTPSTQVTCSFKGSGYDYPSFGGGGKTDYGKQPFKATGSSSNLDDVIKRACDTCANGTVGYGTQTDTCRFVGCYDNKGVEQKINDNIFNLLNAECVKY